MSKVEREWELQVQVHVKGWTWMRVTSTSTCQRLNVNESYKYMLKVEREWELQVHVKGWMWMRVTSTSTCQRLNVKESYKYMLMVEREWVLTTIEWRSRYTSIQFNPLCDFASFGIKHLFYFSGIPKVNSVFAFQLDGFLFTIHGNHFCVNPNQRSRKKFKQKPTVDFWSYKMETNLLMYCKMGMFCATLISWVLLNRKYI